MTLHLLSSRGRSLSLSLFVVSSNFGTFFVFSDVLIEREEAVVAMGCKDSLIFVELVG